MDNFYLFAVGVIAAGFALAGLIMFLATGLLMMTGLHEFAVITTLWLFYKCGETYTNWEEV